MNEASTIPATGAESPPGDAQGAIVAELRRIRTVLETGAAEGLDARTVAEFCGVSKPTWDRMSAAGLTPRSVRLQGCVRWLRSEIVRWLAAGAPDRKTWESLNRPTKR